MLKALPALSGLVSPLLMLPALFLCLGFVNDDVVTNRQLVIKVLLTQSTMVSTPAQLPSSIAARPNPQLVRYLGIVIDCNLSWKVHIERVRQKCLAGIPSIRSKAAKARAK